MSASEYQSLVSNLAQVAQARPITSVEVYLSSHHLPNWYPLIRDLFRGALITEVFDLQGESGPSKEGFNESRLLADTAKGEVDFHVQFLQVRANDIS